jgi:FKBP-type peptidyl-prolyl cis-trans isomerase FklB
MPLFAEKQNCNLNLIPDNVHSTIKTMKTITWAVTFCLGVGCLAGCASNSKPVGKPVGTIAQTPIDKTPAGTNVLGGEKARVSYAIGMMFGSRWKQQGIDVDYDWLVRGLKDAQAGGPTLMTEPEMGNTLNQFQKDISAKQEKRRQEIAEKNKQDGEAFLAENKTKPGVVTLPDGLQYKVITNGDGTLPAPNDVVTVNYRGTLLDGTEFDSSYKRGQPAQFPVGNVIHGWTEALQQMKIGSKWQLFIPPQLAYGEQGRPGVPPNSVLIFEVELLGAGQPTPSAPPAPLTSDIIKVPSLDEMKKGAKIEVIKPEDAAKLQQSQTQPPQTNRPAK